MGAASSIGRRAPPRQQAARRSRPAPAPAARRPVLRQLPQRPAEDRRADARERRSVRRRAQRASASRRSCGSCAAARCRPRAGRARTRRRWTRSSPRSRRALDRAAAAQPNPGRVASRRLNRAEYVNAIHDLLALEVDRRRAAAERHGGLRLRQQRRRPVDHAGADVALHVGGDQDQPPGGGAAPTIRPMTQVYKVEFEAAGLRAERGHAVCDARRPGRSPHLPARRRVRLRASG